MSRAAIKLGGVFYPSEINKFLGAEWHYDILQRVIRELAEVDPNPYRALTPEEQAAVDAVIKRIDDGEIELEFGFTEDGETFRPVSEDRQQEKREAYLV